MLMKITFEILGDPMGKGRPKFSSAGKFVRTYTPKETENYENKVVFFYKKATEYYFDKNELEVNIVAYFKLNKEHYKKKGINQAGQDKLLGLINPTKKPDCDNIAKIILDSLNGIAYYDDSQVVRLNVEKRYAEQPKVVVTIIERKTTNE